MNKPQNRNIEPKIHELFRLNVKSTITSSMILKDMSSDKLSEITGIAPSTVRTIRMTGSGTFFNVTLMLSALGESMDDVLKRVQDDCALRGLTWPTK